jgi:acyl-CoA reductase-like NAD-dependent aldehyde dehydrogenase
LLTTIILNEKAADIAQTCIAATRILVQNSILPQLLPKLKAKCDSIQRRMGNPSNIACAMGPLISDRQLQNVIKIVHDAVSQGVAVLSGGARMAGKSAIDDQSFESGYYYPPTVLIDGPKAKILETRLWKEEAFGPVVVLVGFEDEAEAVRLANDSEFGLGAGLWTSDLSQAFRVAEQIDAGMTWG